MSTMMKRGRIAKLLHLGSADDGAVPVPPGECWVIERPSWVLLMWQAPTGPRQLEVPLRDYMHHLTRGDIHLAASR